MKNLFSSNTNLKIKLLSFIFITLAFLPIESCIDPVPPEFDYVEDLIIIDAIASTIPGTTFATVRKTILEFGNYKSQFVPGCKITLFNPDTKDEISLYEGENSYLVSQDFKVSNGSRWEMKVVLPDGKIYKTLPEIIPNKVSINSVFDSYNKEMTYDESLGKYIPGHEIRVNFQEPEQQDNYYYFQYRAYEKEMYCKICYNGVFRSGECLSQIGNPAAKDYYTYLCNKTCWKISYNQEIYLFDDAFTNGKLIENLLVGKLPLYSKQDVLIEVLQLNITKDAYKYYKTLKDIVDNNSGFNAPLPSALIGNFFNPSDLEDPVLGRFTGAAGSNKSTFIGRGNIPQMTIGTLKPPQPELLGDPLPNPITYESSCIEDRYRTTIKPALWGQ